MNHARGFFKRYGRIGLALIVLEFVILAASCGKDGNIYGSLTWDYYAYGNVGGFPPPSTLAQNVEYQISAGTYEVQYYIWDGTLYWPGGTATPNYYFDSYYTVAADKGAFPFINGTDSHFGLYLSEAGMYKYGAVSSIQTPSQGSGTLTWTQDGLVITVTNKAVAMTPEVLSKLQSSQLKNK